MSLQSEYMERTEVTCTGRLFQMRAVATGKEALQCKQRQCLHVRSFCNYFFSLGSIYQLSIKRIYDSDDATIFW